MMKQLLLLGLSLVLPASSLAAEPTVHVAPPQLGGSRPLEKQTESSVVRDYLLAWKGMEEALAQNSASALDANFVGVARDRLGTTIEAQRRNDMHTNYTDQAHDLQILFYSPEGLSIQMTDTVQYEQQIYEKNKLIATASVRKQYVIVMTPSETRWQVRVFQVNYD